MVKIAFLGAGSTVFARNVIGDCLLAPALGDFRVALHDIDPKRLDESLRILRAMAESLGSKARIEAFLDRRAALEGADFVVNAIQVGGYEPSTVIDFEVPKKYGLQPDDRQIRWASAASSAPCARFLSWMDFARDIEEVCAGMPWLPQLLQPHGDAHGLRSCTLHAASATVGLCHSVQGCAVVPPQDASA